MTTPKVDFPGIVTPYDNLQATRDGRRSLPRYLDVDLSNSRDASLGTALTIPIAGNSFYIDSDPNDGNAKVHFQDANSDKASVPFYVCPGFIAKVPYTFVTIENTTQFQKKIRIVYGMDIDFTPNTTSQIGISGVVSVIDGGKSRTVNNTAFLSVAFQAGLAANYAMVQLWNPSTSLKNVFVEQINFSSGAGASNFNLYAYASQLTTFVANPIQKKLGIGTPSVMEFRRQNNLTPLGSNILVLDPQVKNFKLTEPLMIPPNFGLIFMNATMGNDLSASVEYFEESTTA